MSVCYCWFGKRGHAAGVDSTTGTCPQHCQSDVDPSKDSEALHSAALVAFAQEVAKRVGIQHWPLLRCVCKSWRRGVSGAVTAVRLRVPDRQVLACNRQGGAAAQEAPTAQPQQLQARAGRKAAAAARQQQQQQQQQQQRRTGLGVACPDAAAAVPTGGGRGGRAVNGGFAAPPPPNPDPTAAPQPQPQPQQPKPATTDRGFAASCGRPAPASLPGPDPRPSPVAPNHQHPTAGGTAAAVAAGTAAGCEPTGDTSCGRVRPAPAHLYPGGPPPPALPPHYPAASPAAVAAYPLFPEPPNLGALPLACVYSLLAASQPTVAAAAAAAAAATAAPPPQRAHVNAPGCGGYAYGYGPSDNGGGGAAASDSHAAGGVASSVGSSSIVAWSFLDAADRLAAAYPEYTELGLAFAEPLPLLTAGGGADGGGGGGAGGSSRWLQVCRCRRVCHCTRFAALLACQYSRAARRA